MDNINQDYNLLEVLQLLQVSNSTFYYRVKRPEYNFPQSYKISGGRSIRFPKVDVDI
ncbi:Prophage CP4-57 regulatory [Candidatus Magnetomorum sp. HK-1]|nr:Prophage CP4-57 regulatory [Candidatus Magnetomorum sp. HK-1]